MVPASAAAVSDGSSDGSGVVVLSVTTNPVLLVSIWNEAAGITLAAAEDTICAHISGLSNVRPAKAHIAERQAAIRDRISEHARPDSRLPAKHPYCSPRLIHAPFPSRLRFTRLIGR
jgi:hypothetical protein